MSDQNATVPTQDNNQSTPRTFTQEEVNAMIGKRLSEEKSKFADYDELKAKAAKYDEAEEKNKTELQKALEKTSALESELNIMKKADEVRTIREKVATETGIPANLITGSNEEECKAQAEAIKAFAQPASYPSVRDGGELQTNQNGPATRQQFADYAAAALR